MYAAMRKHTDTVVFLIKHGAEVDAKNFRGILLYKVVSFFVCTKGSR